MHKILRKIEISLAVGCKLDCVFCPQKKLLHRYFSQTSNIMPATMLSFKDFQTILSRVEPRSDVSFSGTSEPFSNPECIPMIKYAYERDHNICLATTLTGVTEKDLYLLRDIQFGLILLHIPDEEHNSKFLVNSEYVSILRYFIKHFTVDSLSCHGTVHHSIKEVIDGCGIPLNSCDNLQSRAGNLEGEQFRNIVHKGRITCLQYGKQDIDRIDRMSSASPMVMPDGRVLLCCMDYSMEHVLGNLLTQSWEEIYQGKEYQKILRGMSGEEEDVLCRRCSSAFPAEQLPALMLRNAMAGDLPAAGKANLMRIVQKLKSATQVAIMGLGGLFRDQYLPCFWNEVFNAALFVDNNSDRWGLPIPGLPMYVVSNPEELLNHPGILAVTFVKNDCELARQLDMMGVSHCNIMEIIASL